MRATRGGIALLLGIIGLGAAAYAAAPQGAQPGSVPAAEQSRASASLPRPKITLHPDVVAASPEARFAFSARGRGRRFQCRLDSRGWGACRSPLSIKGLTAGSHRFSVRTVAAKRHSRATQFRWRVLEPQDFSIAPQLDELGALYPGAPAQALPLTISNPNPVPIFVTGLQVRASADPAGCASAENLILSAAGASASSPIEVPAGGSVRLPAPGVSAPTIQMRDLSVNQDACQRAQFPLAFSGQARG